MTNYPLVLYINYSNVAWTMLANDYETLEWFSDTPKPTQEELDALWPSTEETFAKQNCKDQAQQILNSTDWTTIPDVANPAVSNPYLMNQSEFAAYRSTVRNYAVNPVVDPVWPTIPQEIWSN